LPSARTRAVGAFLVWCVAYRIACSRSVASKACHSVRQHPHPHTQTAADKHGNVPVVCLLILACNPIPSFLYSLPPYLIPCRLTTNGGTQGARTAI
jgi:hypothetical protein